MDFLSNVINGVFDIHMKAQYLNVSVTEESLEWTFWNIVWVLWTLYEAFIDVIEDY